MRRERRTGDGWSLRGPGTACVVTATALALLSGCGGSASDVTAAPDPSKAATALSAGLEAQSAGQLDEAAKQYEQALKYDPKNKYALYDLALIDAAKSNYGFAEEKYRSVLAIDAGYAPALFNLAILVKAKGDEPGAIALYERALTSTPEDAATHLNLGLLLRATGKQSEGDAHVKKALELDTKLKDPAIATPATAGVSPASPSASPSP